MGGGAGGGGGSTVRHAAPTAPARISLPCASLYTARCVPPWHSAPSHRKDSAADGVTACHLRAVAVRNGMQWGGEMARNGEFGAERRWWWWRKRGGRERGRTGTEQACRDATVRESCSRTMSPGLYGCAVCWWWLVCCVCWREQWHSVRSARELVLEVKSSRVSSCHNGVPQLPLRDSVSDCTGDARVCLCVCEIIFSSRYS